MINREGTRIILSRVLLLLTCGLLVFQCACASWKTVHSGKDDEGNVVLVNLNLYGGLGVGHGGIGRKILESYSFWLKPIRREYLDDEIQMTRTTLNQEILQAKGSLRFNADYTTVTINIQTQVDGVFQDFAGNGTYRINEGG
jgi:hypothetical protein